MSRIYRQNHPNIPEGALIARDAQEEVIERILAEPTRSVLLAGEQDTGKAQPLDSGVLTPSGFRRMGDMAVGDEVITPRGTTTSVTGVFPQGVRPVYELTLTDGRKVRADADHLWSVSTHADRYRKRPTRVMTTLRIKDRLSINKGRDPRWQVENCTPADFGTAWPSIIAPYTLGALVGDGSLSQNMVMLSTADEWIVDEVECELPAGARIGQRKRCGYSIIGDRRVKGGNPVLNELKRLGIMGHVAAGKALPESVLNVGVADRLALLQGLLDTDGSAEVTGFEFSSASECLANQVAWLVRSLSGRATVTLKTVDDVPYWRLWGKLPNEIAPFRMPRKLDAMVPATKYKITHQSIVSVEYVGDEPTQCIRVRDAAHEYVTDGFTRTHNTFITSQVLVELGKKRGVIVGMKDTAGQWASRIADQGGPELRVMDSTKKGQANFAALLAGEDGWFFGGWEWFASKDWAHRPKKEEVHTPSGETFKATVWQQRKNKKTGEKTVLCEPLPSAEHYGPAKPKAQSERVHLFLYKRRMRKPLDFFVHDESHKATSRTSVYRRTLVSIPLSEGGWKVALSGTFMGNKTENMWTTPRWLWPDLVEPNYSTWESKYLSREAVLGTNGQPLKTPRGNPMMSVTGEKEPGSFLASLPCYIRIENPIPVPPPKIVHAHLTRGQREQYDELEADDIAWLGDHPLVTELPITRRIRLRTATLGEMSVVPVGAKYHLEDGEDIEPMVTFAEGCQSSSLAAAGPILRNYWAGQKVVIGCHSKKFVKVVVARLRRAGLSAAEWSGDVSSKDRSNIREAFERGPLQYIVAQIESFSTGLDGMQFACSKILWLSESENNTENNQFVRRICRTGVTDFEHIKIIAPGTIAEGVHATKAEETIRMRELLKGAAA